MRMLCSGQRPSSLTSARPSQLTTIDKNISYYSDKTNFRLLQTNELLRQLHNGILAKNRP